MAQRDWRKGLSWMKVALVSSVGGHLAELLALKDAFEDADRIWILNDRSPVLPPGERAYVIAHAERDLRVLWNLVELAAILSRERPDVVLSTGAGPAVPAALVARLAGVPFVYVESIAAVSRLTLTGKLMRPLARSFYVQWEGLRRFARRARFAGGIL
jgi:UDP-N-acetylglucosamine:LPS N-acetylglucosamine transferase